MKTEEIKKGETYSNGKGKTRKVVDEGPQFRLFPMQSDTDCVLYEFHDASGNRRTSKMTRNSFAKWAKKKVS